MNGLLPRLPEDKDYINKKRLNALFNVTVEMYHKNRISQVVMKNVIKNVHKNKNTSFDLEYILKAIEVNHPKYDEQRKTKPRIPYKKPQNG